MVESGPVPVQAIPQRGKKNWAIPRLLLPGEEKISMGKSIWEKMIAGKIVWPALKKGGLIASPSTKKMHYLLNGVKRPFFLNYTFPAAKAYFFKAP